MNDFEKDELLQVLKRCWKDIPKNSLSQALSEASLSAKTVRNFLDGVEYYMMCKNSTLADFQKIVKVLNECGITLLTRDHVIKHHDGKYDLSILMSQKEYDLVVSVSNK